MKNELCRRKDEDRASYAIRLDKFARKFAKQAGIKPRKQEGK